MPSIFKIITLRIRILFIFPSIRFSDYSNQLKEQSIFFIGYLIYIVDLFSIEVPAAVI